MRGKSGIVVPVVLALLCFVVVARTANSQVVACVDPSGACHNQSGPCPKNWTAQTTPCGATPTPTPAPVVCNFCLSQTGACQPMGGILTACNKPNTCVSVCPSTTPTPTATPTPGGPTPTPTIPVPTALGVDPLQIAPCFKDAYGLTVTMGGETICQPTMTARWIVASSVEPDTITQPGTVTAVPWGGVNRMAVSQPGAWGTRWSLTTETDTVTFPCPLTCDGWLWTYLGDNSVAGATVADDVTMYLQAQWAPTGAGAARIVAQIDLGLPDGSGWAEIDVNLGMTPTWPRWSTVPGYVSVAPVDIYRAGDGLRYYVVMDGPALGFTDALPYGAMHDWRIPVSALIRKARTDNPVAFPVPDTATITGFGVAHEQRGEEQQAITIQELHLWAHGPQAMPTPVTP